ncbi:MAG TPA: methyltransferase domain-containing protein [Microthrixaceae bacterium]|nr:methyltransferase domain-containing protein [Microthrixaceae bacterium]
MAVVTDTRSQEHLPGEALQDGRMPGHWLLARLGKKVLRPGGVELTRKLLDSLAITSFDDVVELAPGLGATTRLVLDKNPASYRGVDRDPVAAERVADLIKGPNRSVSTGSAADTGLPDASADVAFGEAYLTMQPASQKQLIVNELSRIVRPGGRIGLHEVAFKSNVSATDRERIIDELRKSIKVHVSPLLGSEWASLLQEAGFQVKDTAVTDLHLLEPKRLIADEGFFGALRFLLRVVTRSDSRKRVLAMRRAMSGNDENLQAIMITAVRLADS